MNLAPTVETPAGAVAASISPARTQLSEKYLPLRIFSMVLIVFSASFLLNSFAKLLFVRGSGGDLQLRLKEQAYIFRGENPFDVLLASSLFPGFDAPSGPKRNSAVIPSAGLPAGAFYPPWTLAFGDLLYWPPRRFANCYFAIFEFLAVIYLIHYGSAVARRAGIQHSGIIFALSPICMSAVSLTIGLGQMGLIVVAALAAAEALSSSGAPMLAGAALAVAYTKPNVSALFVIPFLVRLFDHRLKRDTAITLGVAGVITVFCCMIVWWQTHTNPVEMFKQWLWFTRFTAIEPCGLIRGFQRLGLSAPVASKAAALSCGSVALLAIIAWRRRDLLFQFAVITLASRFCCYHRGYDDMVFTFLLLAIARLAFLNNSRIAFWTFMVISTIMFLPYRFYTVPFMLIQILMWIGGVAVLVLAKDTNIQSTFMVKSGDDLYQDRTRRRADYRYPED